MLAAIARPFRAPADWKPILDPQTGFVLFVGWVVALAVTLT
ncbi:MAG TPA: hypothetical protein VMG55_05975 [Stellaceae bacterium]|nr:hypothetical protein [Stellaceae bacterium]